MNQLAGLVDEHAWAMVVMEVFDAACRDGFNELHVGVFHSKMGPDFEEYAAGRDTIN